ncbi:MAG TPA: hypothetical protein PLL45_17065 [Thermoflexales bacterium]|nr:hypothetical protein [Thermoflexales bacterium]
MLTTIAAFAFALATALAVSFQIALALGAPWGSLAMGGRYPGKFPQPMRVAAVIQAISLTLLAAIVIARARLGLVDFYAAAEIAIWVVVGIGVLSLIMNLATPSKPERTLWAPVALVMVASSLIVALS